MPPLNLAESDWKAVYLPAFNQAKQKLGKNLGVASKSRQIVGICHNTGHNSGCSDSPDIMRGSA
jgi:hypothetical protein